jgi:hypothetical protein
MEKMENAIERRLGFAETIEARESIAKSLQEARDLVCKAQKLANRIGCDLGHFTYFERGVHSLFRDANPVQLYLKYFDACAWDRFFVASGVGQFMSEEARRKWSQEIHDMNVGELTPENIKATFKALMDQSSEFLIDGIVAVAKRIAWDRKTNTPCQITPKVILKHFYGRISTCHGSIGCLDDLERCLRVIEGKDGVPVRGELWSDRLPYLTPGGSAIPYAGKFFDIKVFPGVGTCHLNFNERGRALLPRLNQLLATRYPHVLPPEKPAKQRRGNCAA